MRKYTGQMLCLQSSTVFDEPAVADDCMTSGEVTPDKFAVQESAKTAA